MRLFIASSALKEYDYDLIKTILIAKRYDFDGVQLYLTRKYLNNQYLENLKSAINNSNLEVIFHIPNKFDTLFIPAINYLLENRKKRVVIHYNGEKIPNIEGFDLYFENDVFGIDEAYYENLFRAIDERKNSCFVFDIARVFALESGKMEYDFANKILDRMKKDDIFHIIDLKFSSKEREDWIPFGDGILSKLKDKIKVMGNDTVFEYEDISNCIESFFKIL